MPPTDRIRASRIIRGAIGRAMAEPDSVRIIVVPPGPAPNDTSAGRAPA